MEEFVIPLKPEDLLRPSVEDDYRVENDFDVEGLSDKQVNKLLDGASFSAARNFLAFITLDLIHHYLFIFKDKA
jgi:hypothetical protein